ncbi:MAG TPA: FAD-dependent oxidoreductase, partial [Lentisphaeria bacterium]|nr:FAD-dependent oxidoreductase [Lentisphaeria bacterium]
MPTPHLQADIAVIGGGSGGVAAALAAARCRVKTVLIEQDTLLGGTSTTAGVNCWEPVCGATGIPRRLFDRLTHLPGACGIYTSTRHCFFMRDILANYPGGEQRIVPFLRYQDTLKADWDYSLAWWPGRWNGVVFEPLAWHHAATALLAETGCCHVITGQA